MPKINNCFHENIDNQNFEKQLERLDEINNKNEMKIKKRALIFAEEEIKFMKKKEKEMELQKEKEEKQKMEKKKEKEREREKEIEKDQLNVKIYYLI